MRVARLAVLVVLLVTALACGDGDGSTEPTGGPATTGAGRTTLASPSSSRTAPLSPTPTVTPRPSTVTPPRKTTSPPTPSPPSATCAIPVATRGLDIERLPTSSKVIALTFDAGGNAAGLASILQTLRDEGVPGTFFLKGAFTSEYPAAAKAIAQRYVVGNHTQTHPYLTRLSDAEVKAQIRDAQLAIKDLSGQDPRRFFRFPYGDRDARTINIVNGLCYVAFRWTVDSLGWKGTSGGMTVQRVVDRVVDAAQPGAIVLMHVGSNPDDHTTLDADALPQVIRILSARGYSFISLGWYLDPAP